MTNFDKDFLHDKLCDWFQIELSLEEKKEVWKMWQDRKLNKEEVRKIDKSKVLAG